MRFQNYSNSGDVKSHMSICVLILQGTKCPEGNPENPFICTHSPVSFAAHDCSSDSSEIKVRSSFMLRNAGASLRQPLINALQLGRGILIYSGLVTLHHRVVPQWWTFSRTQHTFGAKSMALSCIFPDTYVDIIKPAYWVGPASEMFSATFPGTSYKKPSRC